MSTLDKLVKRISSPKPTSEPARHARRALQKPSNRFSLSVTIMVLTFVFLFLPLFVVVLYSFNPGKGSEFTGFSLVWYEQLFFNSRDLWVSLQNSFIVALSSAAVATFLGTLAAIGTSWYKFRGKMYIQTISFLPMVLPEVIIGVSMIIFFAGINQFLGNIPNFVQSLGITAPDFLYRLELQLGLFTIFLAHTTFCLPFVYLLVLARLDEFDFSIVEAAYDLGATERQVMLKVIIPAIMPGILSAFLIAITMSLEDFVITFFVSGPGSTTLPLYVYSMIRFGVSPVINALSFVVILTTVGIAFVMRNFLKTIAASK